jgi:hypothetical protein
MRITFHTWTRHVSVYKSEHFARQRLKGKTKRWLAELKAREQQTRKDVTTLINALIEMGMTSGESRLQGRKRYAGIIRRILTKARDDRRHDSFSDFYVPFRRLNESSAA